MREETLWIIDDDMVSQFAIKYKIGQSYPNNRVSTFYSVQEALDALKSCMDGKIEFPQKVLLDLGYFEKPLDNFAVDKIFMSRTNE